MSSSNKLPMFAKLYLKLRPLIVPFGNVEKYVPKKGNVVDIGCGYGIFANYLALQSTNRNVVGIDLNEKRISLANKIYSNLPNLNFICGDITNIQIPSTDVITVIDVLHHIPTADLQVKFLNSCYAALSNGGKLIVKDVDTRPMWKYLFNFIHDFLMTRGEPVLYQDQKTVNKFLNQIGFKVEKILKIRNYPYAHILYVANKNTV